ncbi:hypothetical protein BU26DRAFT_561693 [Trematosphaeria pertusa]|uniref:Uncharacterized protein n=1 Tax=Trematosphaeria pertusa TaxID=390896 RepID=A0A6A6IQ65_9PLEO|nr:uncharacterized protein BU26DRAFT_561693 [Trematosphaeria pertusa]KAF2251902.1 hypothetical protein BU26DRAFT_561693 [Trematosphaeria pertusa]
MSSGGIQLSPAETNGTGALLSADKSSKIEKWLDAFPPSPLDFEEAYTEREATLAHYHDWHDMHQHDALHILHKLDAYERRYRALGFTYHTVPHALRHSPTLQGCRAIGPGVLHRLGGVFEPATPQSEQPFFLAWRTCASLAAKVIAEAREFLDAADIPALEAVHRRCGYLLRVAERELKAIRGAMRAVRDMVEEVAGRIDPAAHPAADLSQAFGVEGGLFRRWIWTFPEVQGKAPLASRVEFEAIAQDMITKGVMEGRWWSGKYGTSGE